MNYKPITIKELEEIMSHKTGLFYANSEDEFGLRIAIICSGIHFDKDINDKSEYNCILLKCANREIRIKPNIIKVIFLNKDGTITIVFNKDLPDLLIKI